MNGLALLVARKYYLRILLTTVSLYCHTANMYRLLRRPFRLPFFSLRAALLAAPLLLGGCIPYPAYKTLQPQARATVVDEQSRPLADTRVILITSSYPYGRERWRDEQRSGEDGVASFENHSEWRAESLMIHGRTIFSGTGAWRNRAMRPIARC
ncbi:hypothetical protein WJ968_07780 [Achromobacter xylosoxidans]